MNKIQFAKLISYLTALMQKNDREMLTYEEIERIEQFIITRNSSLQLINPEILHQLMEAMQDGQKIEATYAYRSLTGYGIKESKDIIEKYWTYSSNQHPQV